MIEDIVPPGVHAAEAFDDEPAPLFAEEEALVAGSGDKRRREFTTVRACARRALAEIGVPPGPLLHGEGRVPLWPPGVVGSLTHCKGYRGAAVALAGDVRSIGIDAEPALPLPLGVLDRISGPDERATLAELGKAAPDIPWDRLLFSAKESLYKTAYPLCRQWFGFSQATVDIHPHGTFTARPLIDLPGTPSLFTGRWLVRDGLLLTVAAVPGPDAEFTWPTDMP